MRILVLTITLSILAGLTYAQRSTDTLNSESISNKGKGKSVDPIDLLPNTRLRKSLDLGFVKVPKGRSVKLYESKQVARILLDDNILFRNILFKAFTYLYFHPSGNVRKGTLARNESVQIEPNLITFEADTELNFYDSGIISNGITVTQGQLVDPQIHLAPGSIFFTGSGKIFRCKISRDIPLTNDVGRGTAKATTDVELYNEPYSIMTAIMTTDSRWGEFTAKGDTKVTFLPGTQIKTPGGLIGFYPPYDVFIKPFIIEKEKFVSLYPNQTLKRFELGRSVRFNNIQIPLSRTIIILHKGGILKRIFAGVPITVGNYTFPANVSIHFDESGILISRP